MNSVYREDEVKYKIDNAVQLSMLENMDNKEEVWNIILDLQTKLYEEFVIS